MKNLTCSPSGMRKRDCICYLLTDWTCCCCAT